jgi:ASC-1-like (ASCH) protein
MNKRIESEVSGYDFSSIRHKMRSAYKLGFNEISMYFNNPVTHEFKSGETKAVMHVIDHEVNNLLGCEIIQQTKNSCLIKDYSITSHEEFENVLRKVFLMMMDYGSELLDNAKTMNTTLLESMREKHFNISKFIFYCLRTINKESHKDSTKSRILYYILSSLDDILDIEKNCAFELSTLPQKRLHVKTINLLTLIVEQFKTFYEYYYKPDLQKLLSFAEKRWIIIHNLKEMASTKVPNTELIILAELRLSLELTWHLFEARMSLDN